MKAAAKFLLVPVLSVSLSCLTAEVASAQAKVAGRSAGAVAIVDVSYIFKNHARFKTAMDKMKGEVQEYEQQLRSRHESLAKERDRLTSVRVGSPDYEKLERSLADKAAKLQVDTQLKKKEFLQREAKVYYHVYQEVFGAVRQFAEQAGIDLVLRYNGDQIDPEDRASVLQGVNRPLVYHRGDLDITREVLDRINRQPQPKTQPRVSRGGTRRSPPRK